MATGRQVAPMTAVERRVIIASSAGTVFEWYDFYLYGSLTAIIGARFFSDFPEGMRGIFALVAFAAGFIVRPLGALFFGRLGDLVGRKYTFLVTMLIMGASTFLVGLLPTAASIGVAAPVILVGLRLLQGLALGGEYGGAAVYVGEYAPRGRRGYYTSFVQVTATAGLFMSLLVILSTRTLLGEEAFAAWGWRIPFLLSFFLLAISVWIRLQLEETPVFRRLKAEGGGAKAPLSEAFGQWRNARVALIALFGLVAGQAVVWYTGQFYALFLLDSVLRVDGRTQAMLLAWALLLGSGGFVLFGWLSDRIGRKPIILGGCLVAALTYFPLFELLAATANPALHRAHATIPVTVTADPAACSLQFNLVDTARFTRPCDIVRAGLTRASVNFGIVAAAPGAPVVVHVAGRNVPFAGPGFDDRLATALAAAGYPLAANPTVVRMTSPLDVFRAQPAIIILVLTVMVLYVTAVYGPIAAALVELFPTRIRYTSVSLPYHIGNGWFGGLLPAVSFAMIAETGNVFFGLWYPIAIALMTVAVGMAFVPETKDRDILAVGASPPRRAGS